jgi:hypothetical protein
MPQLRDRFVDRDSLDWLISESSDRSGSVRIHATYR